MLENDQGSRFDHEYRAARTAQHCTDHDVIGVGHRAGVVVKLVLVKERQPVAGDLEVQVEVTQVISSSLIGASNGADA